MKKGLKWISVLAAVMLTVGLTACGGKECAHTSVTKHDEEPATCYYTGRKAYYVCDDCGEWFLDEECKQSISGQLDPLDIPMKEHSFVDGQLVCTNEGCFAEKPRTTELAGHTYVLLQNYVDWDTESATSEQNDKLYEVATEITVSRHTGTKYEFGTDGSVVSTEVFVQDQGNGTTETRVYNDTYVQEGDTFTISRVFNAGTADEEIETETYALDEYGYWTQSVEIDPSRVAGFVGARAVVVLEELTDHKLRHNEHSFPSGVCDYCGEIETPIMDLAGTTWTIERVETFYYSDELGENDTVEGFVQSWFSSMIGVNYTLHADGSATNSLNGEETTWRQVGNYVAIEIYGGMDGNGQPYRQELNCRLSADGVQASYSFGNDWTWIADHSLVPQEYLQQFSAYIYLTQVL